MLVLEEPKLRAIVSLWSTAESVESVAAAGSASLRLSDS